MYNFGIMTKAPSNTALHAQFITGWDKLRAAAEACRLSVLDDHPLPGWAWQTDGIREARMKASDILTQFLYADDQPPRESTTCPAVLGASRKTVRLAAQLNVRKDRIRILLQAMDERPATAQDGKHKHRTLTAQVLAREGLARLHRMQVYRHVRLVSPRPDRVALGWARTRRVKRRRAGEVRTVLEDRLRRAPYPELILSDIERLSHVGADEWLALVDEEPLHVRANLTWRGTQESDLVRRQVTLALPMLFPARQGDPMPALKPLPDDVESAPRRIRRGGRILEAEPFLRALPVYRYAPEYRLQTANHSPT